MRIRPPGGTPSSPRSAPSRGEDAAPTALVGSRTQDQGPFIPQGLWSGVMTPSPLRDSAPAVSCISGRSAPRGLASPVKTSQYPHAPPTPIRTADARLCRSRRCRGVPNKGVGRSPKPDAAAESRSYPRFEDASDAYTVFRPPPMVIESAPSTWPPSRPCQGSTAPHPGGL